MRASWLRQKSQAPRSLGEVAAILSRLLGEPPAPESSPLRARMGEARTLYSAAMVRLRSVPMTRERVAQALKKTML